MENVLNISAHKYGNYHKYYTFHPSSARISFFASGDVFKKLWDAQGQPNVFSIIDIGCNEGNLSMDVLDQAKKELPSHVTCTLLGIDLDSSLIDLAVAKYVTPDNSTPIAFAPINFMDPEASKAFLDKYLKELSAKLSTEVVGFSMVCLFSITMWIHLNFGDDGLVDFLARSADLLTPLGSLVVEPQPWKCYKAADKRCRKLGITRPLHFSTLQIRDIEREITGMLLPTDTTDTPNIESASTVPAVSSTSSEKASGAVVAPVQAKKVYTQIQAGMKSHWDLGKEGWGRTIYLFHRSAELQYNQPRPVNVEKTVTLASNDAERSDDTTSDVASEVSKVAESVHACKKSKLN